MEIGRLLGKSLPFPSELQNLAHIRRFEEERGRADPLVDPAHGLFGVACVEQELLGVTRSEQVVDHLLVELQQRHLALQRKDLVHVVAVRARRHSPMQRGQGLLERGLRLASGDSDTGFHDAVRGQHDQTRIGDVGQECEREARRSVRASARLIGVRQCGFVAMVAVGDKDRQAFERGVNRRVDRRVRDHPEPVGRVLGPCEADRRRPRGDPFEHLGDPAALALVQEPERFQADLRRAEQREAVFFRTWVSPLVRQHHLVGVGLQA